MTKIAGSGSASGSRSISQRHGSADPDPDTDLHQNVMDLEHCSLSCSYTIVGVNEEALHLLLYFGYAQIFQDVRIYFEHEQIFWVCADILCVS